MTCAHKLYGYTLYGYTLYGYTRLACGKPAEWLVNQQPVCGTHKRRMLKGVPTLNCEPISKAKI